MSACAVSCRQGLSSAGFVSSGEQLQEAVYSSRGQYDEPPSSNRPRPVGGSTGGFLGPRVCALLELLLCQEDDSSSPVTLQVLSYIT